MSFKLLWLYIIANSQMIIQAHPNLRWHQRAKVYIVSAFIMTIAFIKGHIQAAIGNWKELLNR